MTWTQLTICCNEVEWIEHNIRSGLPFFDRIVVVDGAAPGDGLGQGDGKLLTGGSGPSTDGTVEVLRRLEREIPKLKVVYADRPWQGKTAMCNAGLSLVEHGWLIQRDCDEFFHLDALERLKAVVEDSDYTDCEFFAFHFWGDRSHHMRMSKEVWGNAIPWRRGFRWNGEQWASHEPPRMVRESECLLDMDETRALDICLFHYSYSDIGQVRKKEKFYGIDGQLVPTIEQWRKDPETVPKNKDLELFSGVHPVSLPEIR